MATQGAPEAVLARCTHALTAADGGAVVPLTDAGREKVLQWVETAGRRQALRCLGLASRNMPADHRQVTAAQLALTASAAAVARVQIVMHRHGNT